MGHPAEYCPARACCFCCYLNPQLTCCIIASLLITNGFTSCNYGVDILPAYFLSIVNQFMLIFSGVLLMFGTLWRKNRLMIVCCWILFLNIFTSIAGCLVYILTYDKAYLIWDDLDKSSAFLVVIANTAWLVTWDLYAPMIVYGNMNKD